MPFFFVIEIDRINDLLFALTRNFPNSSSDHVTGWQWSDLDSMTSAFQTHILVIFQLLNLKKIDFRSFHDKVFSIFEISLKISKI